ncbi:MAG: protein-disulfide reductase DsbD family protein [Parvularculaceae bacterium]
MRLLLIPILFFSLLSAAAAQTRAVTEHASSELAVSADGVAPGGKIRIALAQDLEDGWHVYWKNPGESGLPLVFDWTLPEGWSAGAISYPAPHRAMIGPIVDFAHEGAPVFTTELTAPPDAEIGSAATIRLEATWLICADICVPETGVFSLDIPVVATPAANEYAAEIFARADADAPKPLPGKASFGVAGDKVTLRVDGFGEKPKSAYFFPSTEGLSEPSAAQKLSAQKDAFTLQFKGGPALADLGDELDGVIETDGGAYQLTAALDEKAASSSTPSQTAGGGSYLGLLIAAFVGGAILNLMPCVFPILFVKAASMSAAAREHKTLKAHGVLYTLGVVATFALLGGLLIALRAGGEELGWGFHLQSPPVVLLSAYVLFLVALNLAGAFSVGEGFQNVGGGLVAGQSGGTVAFMTGVLAVFVAAPCVGPFLTAPVGAAATLPPVEGFLIFILMGLGLAAPYLALSFIPGLARALPKPGRWMEAFRQALAFPVFAGAAFFLWVLAAQTGPAGLALALGGLIILAAAARLWEWGRSASLVRLLALLALAAALFPAFIVKPAGAEQTVAQSKNEIAFDPADIARRRADGEPVFIDFTAAWCVTCQFNKATVFSSQKVRTAFKDNNVAFVTADWTNRDKTIEEALASFGANGVPLYVYYPPGGEAVVLGQPLTANAIVALFN